MFRVLKILKQKSKEISLNHSNYKIGNFFFAASYSECNKSSSLVNNCCYCYKCTNFHLTKRLSKFRRRSHYFLNHNQINKCDNQRREVHTKTQCTCNACLLKNSYSTQHEPRKTCLHDLHVDYQGKVVNFAGWLLPVQYKDTIAISHQHTRTAASIFDVGHMMQTHVSGKYAGEFLESLTPSDLKNLPTRRATLSVFTNDEGGILDDLIITKDGEENFFVVSNAGRRDEDTKLLLEQQKKFISEGKEVSLKFLDPLEQGLVALQGPRSSEALQNLTTVNLTGLKFMQSVMTEFFGTPIRISRCGYTGEDGFEISVPKTVARQFVEAVLSTQNVKLAGLGARDSLRLEAGLCLYGHDIDETTTPVEAGLTWVIAKRRRAEANFPGAKKILYQIEKKPARRRVGLLLGQGPPAREGAELLTPEGEAVGRVTSGGPSPTLGRPIAMGYLPLELCNSGSGVLIRIRGKNYNASVVNMPFIKANYYTGK